MVLFQSAVWGFSIRPRLLAIISIKRLIMVDHFVNGFNLGLW